MAKMIPEVKVGKGTLGESKLYAALKEHLPDDFTVFHSLPFVSVEKGRGVYEHEIDFLVVHRELGFLDIEVKGGREIRYLQKRKRWVSVSHDGEEHVIAKDPYLQASDNIH
ncbi:MAG: nuclease-related domain-containing protein [Actinomycetota bacterium]